MALLMGAVVVFAASTAIVAGHLAPLPGDVGLLEAVNDLPRVVGAPLEVVMQLGTLAVALGVLVVVAVLTSPRGPAPSLAVLVAILVAYRLDNVVKAIVERPRPPSVLDGLQVRDHPSGFAFPSGHSAMAFALAASIAPRVPARWRWVLFLLATGTAVARLYVGVHWPTDLVGGAALGTAIGTGAVLLVDRIVAAVGRVPPA